MIYVGVYIPIHTYIHTYIFFIHLSVDGHLDCFHVLATVKNAAMNVGVHVFFKLYFYQDICPGNEIAGSYGNTIFSFFWTLCAVFHSGCTNFHQWL